MLRVFLVLILISNIDSASSQPMYSVQNNNYILPAISDVSAAIALDDEYMVVADDEHNTFFVCDRNNTSIATKAFDYSSFLGLTDMQYQSPREVDVEAAVRSISTPNRIYWLGSMSNSGKHFNIKPNRNRLFATTITGSGPTTALNYVGRYNTLREHLVTWGDQHGYNFSASCTAGKDPKLIDGFNVEGLVFAPDNTTAYIGFRAPLVPTAERTKAVIAPVLDFEKWFNNGSPTSAPKIGLPIELSLGGRGIRDMMRLSDGSYIIVAGNYDDAPLNPAVYKWNGNACCEPTLVSKLNTPGLNPEAVMEIQNSGNSKEDHVQILSDNGPEISRSIQIAVPK